MPSIFDKFNPFHKIAKVLVPDEEEGTTKKADDRAALRAALLAEDEAREKRPVSDAEMDDRTKRANQRGDIALPNPAKVKAASKRPLYSDEEAGEALVSNREAFRRKK